MPQVYPAHLKCYDHCNGNAPPIFRSVSDMLMTFPSNTRHHSDIKNISHFIKSSQPIWLSVCQNICLSARLSVNPSVPVNLSQCLSVRTSKLWDWWMDRRTDRLIRLAIYKQKNDLDQVENPVLGLVVRRGSCSGVSRRFRPANPGRPSSPAGTADTIHRRIQTLWKKMSV